MSYIVGAVRATLALLLLAILAGCTGPAPTPTATPADAPLPTSITVSLGIYSGRPDPSWELTEAQIAQVAAAIVALPEAIGTPAEGGLGYRGFSLLLRWPGQPDETLVAYRGTVAPPGPGARTVLVDEGRAVEQMLLDTGRSTLSASEIAAVEADLALPR